MNTHCPGCGGPANVKRKAVVAGDRWWCSVWCTIRDRLRRGNP